MSEKFNIYNMVTDRIVAMLDNGIIPWERPWSGGAMAISRATGKPYSFINQMLISPNFDGTLESVNSGEYATFRQIVLEGGKVNRGAKSYKIVFWNHVIKKEEIDGEEVEKVIPILRYYNVFNIKDTTLKPRYEREQVKIAEPSEEAERILTNYWNAEGIKVKRDSLSNRAFYRPSTDTITLPMIQQFSETSEYYSTAFHESVHSTGHKSRLNRIEEGAFFGSHEYSKEELVAEIGASALVSITGLETSGSFRNNAAYIQSWRNAISKDNKLIISATGKAEKAVERILNPVLNSKK